jgi:integrase/recombinase XerC
MRTLDGAWAVALAGYVAYLKAANRSPQTIRLRTYYVERFARETGIPDPWGVTADLLVKWLSRDGWESETRKSARAGLCGFYRWALTFGHVTEDPARNLPPVSPGRAVPRPTPDTVFIQALWIASDRDRLFLMLARYEGMRRAEIARVHTRDLLWQSGEILVHGKGGHERLLPMHPDVGQELLTELERRKHGGHGSGFRYTSRIAVDGHLFPGQIYPHVTADTVGKALDRLLLGDWTGHTLRHGFASAAYAVDRDLRAVQELLGHSKPETTARYVATPTDAKRAAVLGAAEGIRTAGHAA